MVFLLVLEYFLLKSLKIYNQHRHPVLQLQSVMRNLGDDVATCCVLVGQQLAAGHCN